eukprot:9195432-Pyramimonas_sp.AAC.1
MANDPELAPRVFGAAARQLEAADREPVRPGRARAPGHRLELPARPRRRWRSSGLADELLRVGARPRSCRR